MLGFRQRSLHPISRRLRDALGVARRARGQRVYRVAVGGRSYKRVVLPDAHRAGVIAARLRAFGSEAIYPALLLEGERELWVEFVPGRPLRRGDPADQEGLARVLATLQARAPRLRALADTGLLHALRDDLRLLGGVGVLTTDRVRRLEERAEALAPAHLWWGHDCTDAIPKNFVRTPSGRVRAVDVESLGAEVPIGVGPAKACLRWPGIERASLLVRLRELGAPDLAACFPFVELAFLATWTKACVLEGKRRFVEPVHFERFLGDSRTSG